MGCNECCGMGFKTLNFFSPSFEALCGREESVVILVEDSEEEEDSLIVKKE